MWYSQDFSPIEFSLFSEIIWKLGSAQGQSDLRKNILADIAKLLRADFAASYIWDVKQQLSQNGVMWQIDNQALKDYEKTWRHVDPITPLLRQQQKPTFVEEIMPFSSLQNTAYFNEFLKPYGMYYGLNVYFVREGVDVGDLRIWRAKDSIKFCEREKRILNILEPYLTQALPSVQSQPYALTAREHEVVLLVCKGLNDKEVASLLDIGFTTVRTHLKNAMRKIGCHNRTEMTMLMLH